MAIALAQDNVAAGARDNSNASTLTVTFTKTTSAGNTLLMPAYHSNQVVLSSVSDSRGNTWVVDKTSAAQAGGSCNLASCYITIPHQINDTLTLTFASAHLYAAAIVYEFSGLRSSGALDQTASNGTSGAPACGSITTTYADELIFACAAYINASDYTVGANMTAMLTAGDSGAGDRKVIGEYKVSSATETINPAMVGSLGNYNSITASYKATAASSAIAQLNAHVRATMIYYYN